MPRKRDLDPGIWRSEQFLSLPSDTARLCFIAMISVADDLGIGRVSDLRRYADIRPENVKSATKAGLVVTYTVKDGIDSMELYLIPKWCKHQYVNRPTHSKLPPPSNWRDIVPVEYHARYAEREDKTHGALTEDAVMPLSEPHGAPSPSPDLSPPEEDSRRGADAPPRKGLHAALMHELKVGYEAVMGNSTPWKNLGRWAPHVKRLREKRPNLDPADFGARFRAFLELTKQRNIAVQPDQFFDRYDTLEPEPEWKPRPLSPVLVELERRKKARG